VIVNAVPTGPVVLNTSVHGRSGCGELEGTVA
jgi:hypothetical protein